MGALAQPFADKRRVERIPWGHLPAGVSARPAAPRNFGNEDFFDGTAKGDPVDTAFALKRSAREVGY